MTVAFDAQSALNTFTVTNSFTHTPVGTPKGVLVLISENVGVTDVISTVTYGTAGLTQIAYFAGTGFAEPGGVYIFFAGGPSLPTGAQTVSITVTSGTTVKVAWCITVTALQPTTDWCAVGTVGNTSLANPSITLKTGGDFAGFCAACIMSGQAAPGNITAGTNFTLLTATTDFGAQSAVAERANGITGANAVAAFTATADDVMMAAVAVTETPNRPDIVSLDAVRHAANW